MSNIIPLLFIYVSFISFWLIGKRNITFFKLNLTVVIYVLFVKLAQKAYYLEYIFLWIANGLEVVKSASLEGSSFLFGYLANQNIPIQAEPGMLFIFAFQILPITVVFSAIFSLLDYLGVMKFVVNSFGRLFKTIFNVTSVVSINLSANIFLGQTDSILLIKRYLFGMKKGDILNIMTAGMATTAFSVIALYSSLLEGYVKNPSKEIILSTIINIILSTIICKLLIKEDNSSLVDLEKKDIKESRDLVVKGESSEIENPGEENLAKKIQSELSQIQENEFLFNRDESIKPDEKNNEKISIESSYKSLFEAISEGAVNGVKTVTGIGSVLLVVIAFLFIIDKFLGIFTLSLSQIFGYLLYPFMFLIGIPSKDIQNAGSIVGLKTAANEIYAFVKLNQIASQMSQKSILMTVYAICGFSNLSSIAIQIASIKSVSKNFKYFNMCIYALVISCLVGLLNAAIIGYGINR